MTDRPILFSAPMVRALIDGRKTQTRRLAHRRVPFFKGSPHYRLFPTNWQGVGLGDRLWVREVWQALPFDQRSVLCCYRASCEDDCVDHIGDGECVERVRILKWRSPIHMPRTHSRLTLEVVSVRVQRLQDISGEDVIAEGIDAMSHRCGCEVCARTSTFCPATASSLCLAYGELWELLHGKDSWASNPEVVALSFRVHKTNIDDMPKCEAT